MSYALRFHPAVRKDLKKITRQARDHLTDVIFPLIGGDPHVGTRLTGPLRGMWKYRVIFFGVWYRIAYRIDADYNEVVILAVGPRDGFYPRLQRRS